MHNFVTRQKRREVGFDANGSHAGTAAAMGIAERIVQVHVADIGAQFSRAHQAHLSIEIGAVEIDLSAM